MIRITLYRLRDTDGEALDSPVNALRAVIMTVGSARADGLADSFGRWVGVDDTMTNDDLRSSVWGLRGIRRSEIDVLTAPYTGTGREGDQSVVHLDRAADADLWFPTNTGARLPAVPR